MQHMSMSQPPSMEKVVYIDTEGNFVSHGPAMLPGISFPVPVEAASSSYPAPVSAYLHQPPVSLSPDLSIINGGLVYMSPAGTAPFVTMTSPQEPPTLTKGTEPTKYSGQAFTVQPVMAGQGLNSEEKSAEECKKCASCGTQVPPVDNTLKPSSACSPPRREAKQPCSPQQHHPSHPPSPDQQPVYIVDISGMPSSGNSPKEQVSFTRPPVPTVHYTSQPPVSSASPPQQSTEHNASTPSTPSSADNGNAQSSPQHAKTRDSPTGWAPVVENLTHEKLQEAVLGVMECQWLNCREHFQSMEELVNHVNDVHVRVEREVEYRCYWRHCPRKGKGFNARYKMLIHVRTHTNEKPHKCQLCGKSFSRLENLKIHHRSHTGEKPYVCPVEGCNKAYSNSSDRFKHVRTHQVQKPYVCRHKNCDKRYTDPSSLRKHIKTHGHHFQVSGPPSHKVPELQHTAVAMVTSDGVHNILSNLNGAANQLVTLHNGALPLASNPLLSSTILNANAFEQSASSSNETVAVAMETVAGVTSIPGSPVMKELGVAVCQDSPVMGGGTAVSQDSPLDLTTSPSPPPLHMSQQSGGGHVATMQTIQLL